MKNNVLLISMLISVPAAAQNITADSLQQHSIPEVVVTGANRISVKDAKPLSSIDEYLQKSPKIEMIKRGAYAWEPLLNNMPTERTIITIDGMRIFSACTDKMDPVTSYVEISNLAEAEIISGQAGTALGHTIGGAIDLKRKRPGFSEKTWSFGVNSGFESVNQQKIFGGSAAFKAPEFFADFNVMSRNSDNYKAGGGTEVPYSQFRKINFSGNSGVTLSDNKILETSVIYDKASDVGYPALPMDISLAEALIASAKFQLIPVSDFYTHWETKVYFNHLTHRMDDTNRLAVPVRMDMPGWSRTWGYFSHISAHLPHHHFTLKFYGFSNMSTTEMTMYPASSSEKPMLMYTWPQVRTFSQGLYLEDHFDLNRNSSLHLAGSVGFHANKVESEFGLNSLQIFYPEMHAQKNRLLKSISAKYQYSASAFVFGLGAGYGNRAPSVSEGYGFYIFNSSEKYDYIGNPHLNNESSLEANAFATLKKKKFSVTFFQLFPSFRLYCRESN